MIFVPFKKKKEGSRKAEREIDLGGLHRTLNDALIFYFF